MNVIVEQPPRSQLGDSGRPVVGGENTVRGPAMMRGYWARPELNDRVFFRRRVLPDYDDMFYRTGDIVQLDTDGNYHFLGRKDRQVKTRGHRVELDEIESRLMSHEMVEEAAVFSAGDDEGSTQIRATVKVRAGHTVATRELTNYLRQHLPAYAVPSSIVVVEAIPRTTTGKIDRRALESAAARS